MKLTKIEKKPYTQFFHTHLSVLSHSSHSSHQAYQFPHLAQTTLQNGHTWKLIRAESEAHPGRMTPHFKVEKYLFKELTDW